jgi:hypothetical protein
MEKTPPEIFTSISFLGTYPILRCYQAAHGVVVQLVRTLGYYSSIKTWASQDFDYDQDKPWTKSVLSCSLAES